MQLFADGYIAHLGARCIDPAAITAPIPVFHSTWHRIIRPDALARLPADTVLARAVVSRDYFMDLFPRSKEDFPTTSLSLDELTRFNRALESGIQPLGPAGWGAA